MPEEAVVEARRRYYEQLIAAGQRETKIALPPPTPLPAGPIPEQAIVERSTIAPGWYWSGHLPRGRGLRIVNVTGRSSVAFLVWNNRDPSERLNHADTVKLNWTTALRRGHILLSDMDRVLMSVTEDTCGAHDALLGGSTPAATEAKYGAGHRNTRDNFRLCAAKWGLDRRDIPPCLTFFAPVFTGDNGVLTWGEDVRREGGFIELRAEMDVLVALSNCPHPLDPAPAFPSGPLEVSTFRAPPPPTDDFCRTGTGVAVRAFALTNALFEI